LLVVALMYCMLHFKKVSHLVEDTHDRASACSKNRIPAQRGF
jgi:hypothetical protein